MRSSWTTSTLPSHLQFDYWREVICANFTPLSPKRKKQGSFAGDIKTHTLADLSISSICSEAQTVSHGKKEIANATNELYFLLLQKQGTGFTEQDNRACILNPGDYVLIDTTRPYHLSFDNNFEQICIDIPQHMLRPKFNSPDNITNRKVSSESSLSGLVLNYLQALQTQDLLSSAVENEMLANNFLDFLPLVFNSLESETPEISRYKNSQLEVLQHYIRRNLANPELSPAMAGEYHGVSIRYIHKVFANSEDSFGRTVLRLRVQQCAGDLKNPSLQKKSIAEIAYRWGFNDLSYFTKCFKKYHSMTPREWRRQSNS